jgi:hypothetical protein
VIEANILMSPLLKGTGSPEVDKSIKSLLTIAKRFSLHEKEELTRELADKSKMSQLTKNKKSTDTSKEGQLKKNKKIQLTISRKASFTRTRTRRAG